MTKFEMKIFDNLQIALDDKLNMVKILSSVHIYSSGESNIAQASGMNVSSFILFCLISI